MKRLLTIVLLAFAFSATAQNNGSGIKQIKVDDNFFVMTDTVTSTVEFRYPKSALNYYIKDDNETVVFENVFAPKTRVGYIGYKLDSLVDNTNSTFANIDSLESYLRLNTGFNPAGSSATPTLAEVTAEGATTTDAVSLGAISAPSINNPSGALAIVDDVDITGSLDVDDIRLNGNTINRSTAGALRVEGFDFDGTTVTSAGASLSFDANLGTLFFTNSGSSIGQFSSSGLRLEVAPLTIKETANNGGAILSSYGYYWVKDDTPNKPKFTDDAGTDFDLLTNGNITGSEKSADPSDPTEGNFIIWQSDGTGSGDDGDIMIKITAGAVTKTITLVDFSAF